MTPTTSDIAPVGNYANVNGIRMYYEVHGSGDPLVLIHGGASTIDTTFGGILSSVATISYVIAVELQAHGHTSDRDTAESFCQDADDVAELLDQLGIGRADILGFSNGGQTALEIAIRHPQKVRSIIVASAFFKRDGVPAGFWKGFENPDFGQMPQVYKDEFLRINNDASALRNMFNKNAHRMFTVTDWKDEAIKKIVCPVLIVIGDRDLTMPEHAIEMYRLMPNSRLAILPGSHGSYLGEIMSRHIESKTPKAFLAILEDFIVSLPAVKK